MAVPENLGLTTVTLPGNLLPSSHEQLLVSSFLVSFPFPFLPQIPGQDHYVFIYYDILLKDRPGSSQVCSQRWLTMDFCKMVLSCWQFVKIQEKSCFNRAYNHIRKLPCKWLVDCSTALACKLILYYIIRWWCDWLTANGNIKRWQVGERDAFHVSTSSSTDADIIKITMETIINVSTVGFDKTRLIIRLQALPW